MYLSASTAEPVMTGEDLQVDIPSGCSQLLKLLAAPLKRDHHSYCLFYSHGICQKCVELCPVQAISSEGHDKVRCQSQLEEATSYVRKKYGLENKVGCGLCQVGVPCESHIPSPDEG